MLKEDSIRPDVSGFDFYVSAFRELNTCRPVGMGVGPIPFTSIAEYAKIFGVGGEEWSEFLFYMRQMDEEFLKLEKDKSDAASKSKPKGKKK